MYLECCEGELDAAWKVEEKCRMTFLQFRLMLSKQMLMYDPWNDLYAGDDKFRCSTQLHKKRRRSKDLSVAEKSFPETGVMLANLRTSLNFPRFC
jgi:hypothetical protein